jgi:hypothetical protein
MIIAGLAPDERAAFTQGFSDGLPDKLRLIVADNGVLTLIASHPVAQGFCDAMVGLGCAPDLRDAYDNAMRAARDIDNSLRAFKRWAAYDVGETRRPA